MSLIPRDTWFNIEPFFNHFLTSEDKKHNTDFFSPKVDIIEKPDHFEIVSDLPGVNKEDVNVQLLDGMLTIEAKTLNETKSEKDKILRKERHTGYFRRSFNVGKTLEPDDINASFKDGTLTLSFAKKSEALAETKKITIN